MPLMQLMPPKMWSNLCPRLLFQVNPFFFHILSENGSDPIEMLKERFSGPRGFWELKDFCNKANITYVYFSWHSHD